MIWQSFSDDSNSPADRRTALPRGLQDARLRIAGNALFGLSAFLVGFSLAGTWARSNVDVPDADYEGLSRILGVANILLASGACLAWMWAAHGLRAATVLLTLCAAIAGGMEAIGVGTGIPFGEYAYTEQLGLRLGGLVPAVIPAAWFMMVYPALHVAQRTRLGLVGRAALVGLAMVIWDLALDPAMTADFRAWEWRQGGSYYGIPLQNYLGWFLTAFVLGWVSLSILRNWQPDDSRMPLAMYLLQGLFPALLAVLYGRPWAAAAWLTGVALLWGLARHFASPGETSRRDNAWA